MSDESDPPRVFYQLKPREFERVNQPPAETSAQPPAPAEPVPTGLEPAPATDRIEVQDLYRQAATPGPLLPRGTKVVQKNEIHDVLQENLDRANAAGLNTLSPKPKRKSRRLRDFLLLMFTLNGFFAFAAFGPYSNFGTMVFGCAGMIIATLGLGWVMFFVMDDY